MTGTMVMLEAPMRWALSDDVTTGESLQYVSHNLVQNDFKEMRTIVSSYKHPQQNMASGLAPGNGVCIHCSHGKNLVFQEILDRF